MVKEEAVGVADPAPEIGEEAAVGDRGGDEDDQAGESDHVGEVDQGQGEDRAGRADVGLALEEDVDGEGDVEGPGEAEEGGEDPHPPGDGEEEIREEEEGDEEDAVDREKVGCEVDQGVGLVRPHAAAGSGGAELLHPAPADPDPEGVGELVAEDVGADRLLEDPEQGEVGDQPGEEVVLRLEDAQDVAAEDDGGRDAGGEKEDAEEELEAADERVHGRSSNQ